MNGWLILFIALVFIASMFSYIVGWFAGRKYQKLCDKEIKNKNNE